MSPYVSTLRPSVMPGTAVQVIIPLSMVQADKKMDHRTILDGGHYRTMGALAEHAALSSEPVHRRPSRKRWNRRPT